MMPALRITAALLAVSAALNGCASPASHFYALAPASVQTATPLAISVAVGPVTIPAEVDTPKIVLSVSQYELRPDEYNRWAAPLQEEISRTVAADIANLLGTGRVTLSTNTAGPVAQYRASIEVERFESVLGQKATVEAEWAVTRATDGASLTGRTVAHEDVDGPGFRALAAAHSRAIERLSRDIADAVRALEGRGKMPG